MSIPLRHLTTAAAATTAALALSVTAPAGASELAGGGAHAKLATSAPAGTLVFIKDHDVWIARADGSGARPVTTDGTESSAYHSPTQSDTGTIAAGRGQLIIRMTQHGRVLTSIDPQPLTTSTGHPVDGVPVDVAISPDGSRIAYSFYTYECPVGASCGDRYATGYTAADRFTPSAPQDTSYLNSPAWVTDRRTVQGGGFGSQVNLHDLGSAPIHWFDDSAYSSEWQDWEDLSEPDVSPDGTRLAAVRSYGDGEHIAFFEILGDPRTGPVPAAPYRRCATSRQAGFADPTWSADSTTVGWEEPTGVWMLTDPVPDCAAQPRLVIPGASEPDFSAAPLTDAPTDPPVATPADPTPAATTATLRNTARPVVHGRARVGSVLTTTSGRWTARPTSYRYQWFRNRTPIRGATQATYTLTRKDAGKKVRVSVTAVHHGARASSSSRAVSVRR